MDYKLESFLMLCSCMNYRITAEKLHITQPAVTKQIHTLEQIYGVKLFTYDGRKLHKTEACKKLEQYCKSLQYNYDAIKKELSDCHNTEIRIGATKTIGDFCIFSYIKDFIRKGDYTLSVEVDNTSNLLKKLDESKLDFAVVEGFFKKQNYSHRLLKSDDLIGICAKASPLAYKTIDPEEMLDYPLFMRENGSGTRLLFENEMKNVGYSIDDFKRVHNISSFKLITDMVESDLGISCLYSSVIKSNNNISTFKVNGFSHVHEFNIVWLKNTFAEKYVDLFFND